MKPFFIITIILLLAACNPPAQLPWAARIGDIDKVRSLLDTGVDVNTRDENGYTALMKALEYEKMKEATAVARLLIDRGADVNAVADYGWTALMGASQKGNLAIAAAILAKGARVNPNTDRGMTPLLLAAENGHARMVRLLITNGADIKARELGGNSALLCALPEHTETAAVLVSLGADVNAQDTILGHTPLMTAAYWGNSAAVALLLKAGADVFMKTAQGETALTLALKKSTAGKDYGTIISQLREAETEQLSKKEENLSAK